MLDVCLNDLAKINRNRKIEKTRGETTHGFLRKCQPPACPRNPVATKNRSERTQCQAKKTRNTKQVTRWKVARQSGKENIFFWKKTTVRN